MLSTGLVATGWLLSTGLAATGWLLSTGLVAAALGKRLLLLLLLAELELLLVAASWFDAFALLAGACVVSVGLESLVVVALLSATLPSEF